MGHLVLVEGFPGCGKSTTAQWLATQLGRQGRACRWIYEQQRDHPVCGVPAGVEPSAWEALSWPQFCDDRVARWTSLAAGVHASDTVTILESALFQHLVFVMLRREVAADVIVSLIVRIARATQLAAPRLVYLRPADPDAAYRAIAARRGTDWVRRALKAFEGMPFARRPDFDGFDGLLAYWREHNTICERAVAAVDIPTLIVDARRGDWAWQRREIAGFLGIQAEPDRQPPRSELARYVGHYEVAWSRRAHVLVPHGEQRQCSVTLRDDTLLLHDVLWPDNRLLWNDVNRFYAESWPYEVIFDEPAAGATGRLTMLSVGDEAAEQR